MKNISLILVLFVAIPSFGQRKIPHATIAAIEARMTDLKSSLFLLDSLYKDYLNIGSFTIQDEPEMDSNQDGSSWLYNKCLDIRRKYPKECTECKTKEDELVQLMDKELRAAQEASYRKVIQKADNCFTQRNFLKAKEYYQRAVNFMPSDPYPKQKLEEVNAIIAEQEKNEN